MKKTLLLTIAALITLSSYAQYNIQRNTNKSAIEFGAYKNLNEQSNQMYAAKSTAVGDTFSISHFSSGDTSTVYSFLNDSGFVVGMNAFEDQGFAERYDVDPVDSTIKVLGVVALFSGSFMPSTTQTVSFHVWSEGAKSGAFRPTIFNSGLPSTSLTSGSRSITQLGIGLGSDPDTAKAHVFATPTGYLTDNFFVGYTISYTWAGTAGDTIGLYTNKDNDRDEVGYTVVSASDTTLNNLNVTQGSDNVWRDNGSGLYGLFNNLYIFPIVKIGAGTGSVHGITRKDFTFYGNYPNPANNSTNVKIALAHTSDVTIEIMDLTGKHVSTINKENLTAGEHSIPVNTSDFASGEYIYSVRTSSGAGIASKFVVIK